jgi:hypothetical protein
MAIFLESAKRIFYVGESLDLGNQQAECLNIRAPIKHGVIGKIPQHFDRDRARDDDLTIVQMA